METWVPCTWHRSGFKTIGRACVGDLYGEIDVVTVVVAGQEQDIDEGWGYSPAKPKTERPAFAIGMASKQLVGSVVGTCRVMLM